MSSDKILDLPITLSRDTSRASLEVSASYQDYKPKRMKKIREYCTRYDDNGKPYETTRVIWRLP